MLIAEPKMTNIVILCFWGGLVLPWFYFLFFCNIITKLRRNLPESTWVGNDWDCVWLNLCEQNRTEWNPFWKWKHFKTAYTDNSRKFHGVWWQPMKWKYRTTWKHASLCLSMKFSIVLSANLVLPTAERWLGPWTPDKIAFYRNCIQRPHIIKLRTNCLKIRILRSSSTLKRHWKKKLQLLWRCRCLVSSTLISQQ